MLKPQHAKKRWRTAAPVSYAAAAVDAEIFPVYRLRFILNLSLCGAASHRYNQQVVARPCTASSAWIMLLAGAACWLASCATSLGPGYVVEKQQVQVSFVSQAQPRIHILAEYRLKNTGNQVLDSLEVRLPGRRFSPIDVTVRWDGATIPQTPSADNPRDTLLGIPKPWTIGASHTVQFAYDIGSNVTQQGSIGFTPDAFNLPAEGWTPSFPQARGVFGFGGVPPEKWELVVRVPHGFLVHASGSKEKHSAKNAEVEFQFVQSAQDLNPFVIAGTYRETRQDLAGNQQIRIWSRTEINLQDLRQAGDLLSKTLATYDSLFGSRGKSRSPLWIVECPAETGCFSQRGTIYSSLLYGAAEESSAEMISRDTVAVDPRIPQGQREVVAGPALAAGWLGYGQNPGFYEQQPPMSALPAFAAALAREISSGAQIRSEIIQRALAQIPAPATRESNHDPVVSRAKGLLLFYALRDRVGSEHFQKALQHMLSARQTRGFDISDLISALEEESHQSVGSFVREWIKRPGVPENFRALYSQSTVPQDSLAQEATQ
jgi:hypothetical protein